MSQIMDIDKLMYLSFSHSYQLQITSNEPNHPNLEFTKHLKFQKVIYVNILIILPEYPICGVQLL